MLFRSQLTFRSGKIPEEVSQLSEEQRQFLSEIEDIIENNSDPEKLQQALFEHAKETLGAKQAFQAIYLAFLGRKSGPRAAWLLLDIPADQRREHLEAVLSGEQTEQQHLYEAYDDSLTISESVAEKFPSIVLGVAVIKGISVEKSHPELEKEKQEFLQSLHGMTVKDLGSFPELTSYRRIYKEIGRAHV